MSMVVSDISDPQFGAEDLLARLEACDPAMLDRIGFGVVRMNRDGDVVCYNDFESRLSGLSPGQVVGRHFFTAVGPCMNNFMVAHRFENEDALDSTIDYLFTFAMRPTSVRLRLLKSPDSRFMYLLVQRRGRGGSA